MNKKQTKIDIMENETLKLNESFHDKSLLNESFYSQLVQKGFKYTKCVLVSIFPDSSNTYCGIIIKQDGSIFEFDLDLDSPKFSIWEDITNDFTSNYIKKKRNLHSKEATAYNLFVKQNNITSNCD